MSGMMNPDHEYDMPNDGYQMPNIPLDASHLEARNPHIKIQKQTNGTKVKGKKTILYLYYSMKA